MIKRKNLLFVGLLVSYLVIFISTSRLLIYASLISFALSAFLYFKNIKKSLLLFSVFFIPYSIGKTIFPINEGNYFKITPFMFSVIALSFFSIKNSLFSSKNIINDIFLILFLLWGIISFIIYAYYPEVFDGIFKLNIYILLYFICRIYLKDVEVKSLATFILISIIVFESLFTIFQFLIGHPLGVAMEEGLSVHPYGRLASEDVNIFRPFGTFGEPTWLARFLTMLLPIVLIKMKTIFPLPNWFRLTSIILAVVAIFVSFTRVSWAVTIFLFLVVYFLKKPKINFKKYPKYIYFGGGTALLILGVFFYPYFEQRWRTTPVSFEEGGSFHTRINLVKEAINLIEQYPVFGVGLNRFKPMAQENNVTGYFGQWITPVHNVPLLIASEMGIPAVIFFIGFIIFCYKIYFEKRKYIKVSAEKNFKDAAALGGIAYILESQMGTIFLSPHLSLFFLYMAIITS